MMISTILAKKKAITEAAKRDRFVEESCFSKFHIHFHPGCKKRFPLEKLIRFADTERTMALDWYEENENYTWLRKRLLKAIPGMSTVLGGEPWAYSDSYSAKQALEIYINFLTIFLQKHPYCDVNSKKCSCSNKKCESKRSIKEFDYQRIIIDSAHKPWISSMNGCFECLQYCCEACDTKIFFKELYRDLDNTKICSTMECEHCIKSIAKRRFKARKHLRMYQQKKRRMNDKNTINRYGDIKYFYIPDYIPSSYSIIVSTSCSGNTEHVSDMIRHTLKTCPVADSSTVFSTNTSHTQKHINTVKHPSPEHLCYGEL